MPTDIVFIVARILMGGPFLVAGIRNFRNLDRLVGLMSSRKVPQARIVTMIGVAVQTLSGLLIVLGILTPWAALGEAAFLAAATLIVHPFWTYPKDEQFPHINACIVNTALVGSFLMLFAISI
ncbi:MAG TPA: DoxX family protein [Devosia sp.]